MKRLIALILFLPLFANCQVITTFYTKSGCADAELTTNDISSITQTTASSGGNISFDGGCAVTARGVCWNTGGSPTTSDSKTEDGTGTGSFSSSITSLTHGTLYYVRAYATTAKGTFYGTQTSFTTLPAVGDTYGGGVVFYITDSGAHGYISPTSNQSTSASWGCAGTDITGSESDSWGGGYQNTIDIVNGCGTAGIAAKICSDLSLNGYTDWYLPCKTELLEMYQQRTYLSVSNIQYWASNEYYYSPYTKDNAWTVNLYTGGNGGNYKASTYYVRCIRKY